MIAAIGYQSPTTSSFKDKLSMGFSSPLRLRSSLFISSRRPSIPLSPTLLPLLSFPSIPGQKIRSNEPSDPLNAPCGLHHGFTPIHQLPVEILCDIFSYCDPESGEECGPKITISHVCRRWRAIVLCMPLLWTNISVRNPNPSVIDKVTTYLRRSGSCPISLSVAEDTRPCSEQQTAIEQLWAIVRSHHLQMKSLRLELRGSVQNLIRHFSGCQFPVLDSLDLHLRSCPTTLAEDLISTLQHNSNVSSLVWRRADNLPVNISWTCLTHVQLNGSHTLEGICTVLRQCCSIQELSLKSVTNGSTVTPQTTITLPALSKVTIYTHVSIAYLLDQLCAPALKTVYINHSLHPGVPRDWRAFSNLLLRSNCELEKFTIWDRTIDDAELIQYLRLPGMQSLADLHVHHPVSDTILRALSPSTENGSSCALPHLKSIVLSNCQSSDGVLRDVLTSRLESRREDLASLRHFEVGFNGDHSSDEAYLKSLQSADLNIKFYRRSCCL